VLKRLMGGSGVSGGLIDGWVNGGEMDF